MAFLRQSDLLSWRAVRAFGSLTVLTRASYAMLVLVPIMAGAWGLVIKPVMESGKLELENRQRCD